MVMKTKWRSYIFRCFVRLRQLMFLYTFTGTTSMALNVFSASSSDHARMTLFWKTKQPEQSDALEIGHVCTHTPNGRVVGFAVTRSFHDNWAFVMHYSIVCKLDTITRFLFHSQFLAHFPNESQTFSFPLFTWINSQCMRCYQHYSI